MALERGVSRLGIASGLYECIKHDDWMTIPAGAVVGIVLANPVVLPFAATHQIYYKKNRK